MRLALSPTPYIVGPRITTAPPKSEAGPRLDGSKRTARYAPPPGRGAAVTDTSGARRGAVSRVSSDHRCARWCQALGQRLQWRRGRRRMALKTHRSDPHRPDTDRLRPQTTKSTPARAHPLPRPAPVEVPATALLPPGRMLATTLQVGWEGSEPATALLRGRLHQFPSIDLFHPT